MDISDVTLDIKTLGCFSISVEGKTVATDWPGDTTKLLFCSLLSPLDLCFSWDRICRSVLGVPATRTIKLLLEESVIRPLNRFLIKELGFSPIIAGHENIRIDQQRIHVDALEFHDSFVEGISLLSLGNYSAALEKFGTANSLYAGSYLPEMSGKIIANTRKDLESLYRENCDHGRHTAQTLFRMFGCTDSDMNGLSANNMDSSEIVRNERRT